MESRIGGILPPLVMRREREKAGTSNPPQRLGSA
jgi:hypothetical protein